MTAWRGRGRRSLLGALLFSAGVLLPSWLQAEIITGESVVRGSESSPQQCAAYGEAVWVQIQHYGVCIRYYISTDGGSRDIPIVNISGDLGGVPALHSNARSRARTRGRMPGSRTTRSRRSSGREGRRSGRPRARTQPKDRDTRRLLRGASRLSRQSGTTGIHLARMGMDGSSGFHSLRRTYLELYVTNAALDQLKQRYRFRGFNLVGQSGGSTLIGGLLGLRNDIFCAVPGSGRLAMLDPPRPMRDPLLNRFDPIEMLPNIVRYRNARILVVTDPQDRIVDRRHQDTFVQRLRAAGRPVEQYYVVSPSEKHHGVSAYAALAAAGCIHGKTYDEITDTLRRSMARQVDRSRQNGSDPWGRGRREPGEPQEPERQEPENQQTK